MYANIMGEKYRIKKREKQYDSIIGDNTDVTIPPLTALKKYSIGPHSNYG